jgi:hypothetical protein
LKRIIIVILFLASTSSSFAQSNFYKFSIGAGFGATQSFTEVPKHGFGLSGYGSLDYLFTPFASLGLEIQKGEVNGGEFKKDPLHREFVNSYQSFAINAKISLGQIIDDRYNGPSDLLKGIYLGAGAGIIKNSTLFTTGLDPNDRNFATVDNADSKDVFFPLNLGINIHFPDREGFYRYVLNFNYQANFTLGEGLDGYDDSQITFQSGTPDIFSFFSVGLKYNFGKMGLSGKTFRKY